MKEKILEQILKNTNCEYQTIRSGQLKCLADSKDIHTCICSIQDELLHICKTKCPIYRLKEKLSTAETAYQICLINKECRHRKEIDKYKQAFKEINNYLEACRQARTLCLKTLQNKVSEVLKQCNLE